MIQINLALRKQSGMVSENDKENRALNFYRIFAGLKNSSQAEGLAALPIKKYLLSIAVGVLLTWTLDDYKSGEIKKVEAEIEQVMQEQNRLKAESAKIKGYEETKKVLDADEKTLITKIDVIRKLLEDRQAPPQILMTFSSAIPSDVWLSSLRLNPTDLEIKGFSVDYNQISDFMKSLNESAYFKDVQLKNTQQEKDVSGLEVAGFELQARRR